MHMHGCVRGVGRRQSYAYGGRRSYAYASVSVYEPRTVTVRLELRRSSHMHMGGVSLICIYSQVGAPSQQRRDEVDLLPPRPARREEGSFDKRAHRHLTAHAQPSHRDLVAAL